MGYAFRSVLPAALRFKVEWVGLSKVWFPLHYVVCFAQSQDQPGFILSPLWDTNAHRCCSFKGVNSSSAAHWSQVVQGAVGANVIALA